MVARKMTISDRCRKGGAPNTSLIATAQREIFNEALEILRAWPVGKGMKLHFILEMERPKKTGS